MAIDVPPPALPPTMLAAMADTTLVGLIAAGSDDAFAALDARYRRRLVRFARGFVTGGTADAEDVVQDAMVRAVRALRNGSRPDAPGPWLHRITRNCALDLMASRRRHPVVELPDHAGGEGLVSEDAQQALDRRLGVRTLVADVSQLPDTQRSALVLRELEGRSYAAIADELDVTVPAVKSLLVRARQGLRRVRDDRRIAAWMPLPLLARLAERAGTLWEPVAAGAAPKVACAAVVVIGAMPVAGGTAPVTRDAAHQAPAKAHHAQADAPGGPAPAPTDTTIRRPAATAASLATATITPALATALKDDCTDGTIDHAYSAVVLRRALGASGDGGEYGGCHQALMQAQWLPHHG
jgi:RNA polymerase sigma factor (sigma-70 family)